MSITHDNSPKQHNRSNNRYPQHLQYPMLTRRMRILQLNCNRQQSALDSLINKIIIRKNQENQTYTNILCLQECPEPMPQMKGWTIFQPGRAGETRQRTAICVPDNLGDVSMALSPTNDIPAVNVGDIWIVNVYQPPENTRYYHHVISHLLTLLMTVTRSSPTWIGGDFNSIHPSWSRGTPNNLGTSMADFMFDMDLSMISEPYEPTFIRSRNTIDLVFGTDNILELIEECSVDLSFLTSSDHLTLSTIILTDTLLQRPATMLWRYTNWQKFNREFSRSTAPIDYDISSWNENQLDLAAVNVTEALQSARDEATPIKRYTRIHAPWWHPGLTRLRQQMQSAYDLWDKWRYPADFIAYKYYRAWYRLEIQRAKDAAWKVAAEDLNLISIWRAVQSIQGKSQNTTHRPVEHGNVCATTPLEKLDLFASLYFPYTNDSPRPIPSRDNSPVVAITRQEVDYALSRTAPLSSPGLDGIPALALKSLSSNNIELVLKLYNCSLSLGHFPVTWKHGRTIVLRKPGKKDYSKARSFRPITMLPSIGKLMEKIIANRFRYLICQSFATTHPMVPRCQFGFLPQRSCEQATAVLLDAIRNGWSRGLTTTVAFLDVRGAYDTVLHDQLLTTLSERQVPAELIRWLASFLRHRRSTLQIEGHTKTYSHGTPPRITTVSHIVHPVQCQRPGDPRTRERINWIRR
jgi:hypothetical protein